MMLLLSLVVPGWLSQLELLQAFLVISIGLVQLFLLVPRYFGQLLPQAS
jgi:hypothetical protein